MEGMDEKWITTGEASKILGYSPEHFRNKFDGLIPCFRLGKGHRRWLRAAVEELRDVNMPVSA